MTEGNLIRTRSACTLLPEHMRKAVDNLGRNEFGELEEFRLRCGKPFSAVFASGERILGGKNIIVTREDIGRALELATEGSMHTALGSMTEGFVTVRDGHRVGICGAAVMKDGMIISMKWISSISIRIAKEYPISFDILRRLTHDGGMPNTIILSLPGQGKTTLLRDMIKNLSDGVKELGLPGYRISLADERGEVAAACGGAAQLDVGLRTDVMSNVTKADGIMMLLRSMSPQIAALDEITAPEDIRALTTASYCGVGLLATAHAGSVEDLKRRPLYRELLTLGVFEKAVVIEVSNGKRRYKIENLTD